MEKVAYSVPFCLRILNCSGDRIARHSSSGLLTDPGAGEAIATIRPRWKLRENDEGEEGGEEERLRRLRCDGEEANRVVLAKALMVEAKVKDVAEDTRPDDVMTFNAIVVSLFILFLPSFFFRKSLLMDFFFVSNLQLIWAYFIRP